MLTLYRKLIELRRREAALSIGSYAPVAAHGDVLAYIREHAGRRFFVALNLSHRPGRVASDRIALDGVVRTGTNPAHEGRRVGGEVTLDGDEAIVVELDGE